MNTMKGAGRLYAAIEYDVAGTPSLVVDPLQVRGDGTNNAWLLHQASLLLLWCSLPLCGHGTRSILLGGCNLPTPSVQLHGHGTSAIMLGHL